MKINTKKCAIMTFTRSKEPLISTYYIKGEALPRENQTKDLGVLLQPTLNFVQHAETITKNGKRNLGIIMRQTKYFKNIDTIRTLYYSLVRSNIECSSTAWGPLNKKLSKQMERIQKIFLRYLYYKDFGYYGTLTYKELVLGYAMDTLKVRRDTALLTLLRDLLCAKLDSPALLEKVGFFAPTITNRRRNLFHVVQCRTTLFSSAPLNRALFLYNRVEEINKSIDLFFDSRMVFRKKVAEALTKLEER
jgi:hypothetical protein